LDASCEMRKLQKLHFSAASTHLGGIQSLSLKTEKPELSSGLRVAEDS